LPMSSGHCRFGSLVCLSALGKAAWRWLRNPGGVWLPRPLPHAHECCAASDTLRCRCLHAATRSHRRRRHPLPPAWLTYRLGRAVGLAALRHLAAKAELLLLVVAGALLRRSLRGAWRWRRLLLRGCPGTDEEEQCGYAERCKARHAHVLHARGCARGARARAAAAAEPRLARRGGELLGHCSSVVVGATWPSCSRVLCELAGC
jgi:hypothetical protein